MNMLKQGLSSHFDKLKFLASSILIEIDVTT